MNRRKFIAAAGTAGLAGTLSHLAGAASAANGFPNRPVTVVVGFSAGGPTDVLMRKLNETARRSLNQALVVENRLGAAGSVAISQLAKKAPDGYTLGALLVGSVVNQHVRKVDYDTARLSPVLMFGTMPQGIVVRNDAPWKDIRQFLAYAKANPGSVRFSTAGIGTAQHFSMERLAASQGIKWIHIPFKGGNEAVSALLAGEVEACAQTAEWKPFVQRGQLRLLATFTEARMPDFPQIPTMRDIGIDMFAPSMMGIVGPPGMDAAIVERLHDAYRPGLDEPEFRKMLDTFGVTPEYRSPDGFRKYLVDANAYYAESVREVGPLLQP